MLKIKEKPEDFIVKEVIDLKIIDDPGEKGEYSYYMLTKTNMNTIDALNIIAAKWRIKEKFINFAGTKDKNAITEQVISISNGPKKDLYLDDITLKYIGQGNERINLGTLKGNKFEIIVTTDKKPRKFKKVINYFDDQRFGSKKSNHLIGKLLIKKDFKKACELLGLDVQGNNFVGALKTFHKKTLMLFIHAYQSYLWNEIAKEYVKGLKHIEIEYSLGKLIVPLVVDDVINVKIPLIGFGAEEDPNVGGKVRRIMDEIMKKEEITFRDFIIRELQGFSSDGDIRDLVVDVKNLMIEEIGENKYKMNFYLDKGCYATVVVKSLFC